MGIICPPLVEIGWTDLPKSGFAMAHPAQPGTTGLEPMFEQFWNQSNLTWPRFVQWGVLRNCCDLVVINLSHSCNETAKSASTNDQHRPQFYFTIHCQKVTLSATDLWNTALQTYEDCIITGKSLSEALIFASTRPKYDDRLFIELQVQYMKIPSLNRGRTCCVQKLFLTFRTIFVHNMFSPCSARRRASDKDLPVLQRGCGPIVVTFSEGRLSALDFNNKTANCL